MLKKDVSNSSARTECTDDENAYSSPVTVQAMKLEPRDHALQESD
jgi:hypothetical protein